MKVKTCSACGDVVAVKAKVCPHCGARRSALERGEGLGCGPSCALGLVMAVVWKLGLLSFGACFWVVVLGMFALRFYQLRVN